MVDVTCPGCSASYSLAEKRIPERGMEMRCPQCSANFTVRRPDQTDPAPTEGLASTPQRPVPPPRRKRRSLFSSRPAQPNEEFHSAAVDDLFGEADSDGDFGVIDMALPGSEIPLAAPDGGGDLPMAATDLDLPMAAGDLNLPAVAGAGASPQTGQGAPDDAGLPMLATDGGTLLPSPQHKHAAPAFSGQTVDPRRPPVAAPPARGVSAATEPYQPAQDQPAQAPPAQAPPFDDMADLPMPADFSNLPSALSDGDLPMRAAHADLPMPADQDLPLPAPNADLPLPADFDFPTSTDRQPMSQPGFGDGDSGRAPGSQPFDPDFDQFELAEDPLDRLGQTEVMTDPDQAALQQDAPGQEASLDTEVNDSFGDEFDLEGAAQRHDATATGAAPRVRLKRKTSKLGKLAFVAIPLVAVAGGMLYMIPSVGPFGAHAISDYVNRSSHDEAYASLLQEVEQQMGLDTAAGTKAATGRAQTLTRSMPRFAPVAGTAAFLAFWNEIRFGTGSQDVATGKQLIAAFKDDASGPEGKLALVAEQAAGADPKQAYAAADAYVGEHPEGTAGRALAGEMALRAQNAKAALAHYGMIAEAGKTALASYGLARAHHALGAHDKAQREAEEALKHSKDHAGARTLLATLLWTQNNKDERPLKLVQEVVTEGPVRAAASRAELVLAYSLSGEIHLSRAHMTDAEKAFEQALKMDPQSQRALLGNGELLFQAGRYSEALARFEAAHRPNPTAELPLVGTAKTKIALERASDAKKDLLAIATTSKHPLVGYWLARAEEALGKGKEAEKWYRHALKVGASHADAVHAYVALADLLRGQGRHQEAAEVLSSAGKNLPRSVALHNARGDVALTSGRVTDAKREFEAALEIDPSFTPSRFRLAAALRRNRELTAAEAELKKVLESDPEYPGLALERGLLFEAGGKRDQALAMYSEALKKAPDDVDLKLRVGSTQVNSGHPQQAAKLLREVLAKRPRSAEVNHYLGRALLLNGDYLEALRYLETAVRYDTNRAEYHLYVAWAANEAGRVAVAAAAVDKALEIDQQLGDAYWQRAIVKQKYGRTLDALKDLKLALELNPTRYEAYATMALCQQDQSNYKAAEEAWRKAIGGNAKVAEWRFRLGKVLYDRGAKDDAAKHLEAAVDLAKTSKRAKGWLWNANYLLGDSLRRTNPKRALVAYQDFIKQSTRDNAYRADADAAVAELEKR